MDGTPLRIEELVKRFGNVAAVDGVSLKVKPGEYFGLLGPNGAGKSTLIRSIVGRVRPSPGRILIFGETAESAAARAGCDRTGPPLQPQILKRHFQLNEAKRWVVDLLYADARARRCTSHKTAEQVAHTAVYGQELRVTLEHEFTTTTNSFPCVHYRRSASRPRPVRARLEWARKARVRGAEGKTTEKQSTMRPNGA